MQKRVAKDSGAPAHPAYDRRATPREPVLLPAILIGADDRERACMILDRSSEGFRIRLETEDPVPDEFRLVDLLTGAGHEACVAWRDLPMVGSRCLRSYDLHVPQQGVGQVLQRIWTAALT